MSHTIRISDTTYDRVVAAKDSSGKSISEVVDDAFEYVVAMSEKLRYEKLTGMCLRCGSKKSQKSSSHYG